MLLVFVSHVLMENLVSSSNCTNYKAAVRHAPRQIDTEGKQTKGQTLPLQMRFLCVRIVFRACQPLAIHGRHLQMASPVPFGHPDWLHQPTGFPRCLRYDGVCNLSAVSTGSIKLQLRNSLFIFDAGRVTFGVVTIICLPSLPGEKTKKQERLVQLVQPMGWIDSAHPRRREVQAPQLREPQEGAGEPQRACGHGGHVGVVVLEATPYVWCRFKGKPEGNLICCCVLVVFFVLVLLFVFSLFCGGGGGRPSKFQC